VSTVSHEAYGRIEQATADAKEDPRIHGKREAKAQGDVQEDGRLRSLLGCGGGHICELRTRKCKEQKEKGTGKLAQHGNNMVSDIVRQIVSTRKTPRGRMLAINGSRMSEGKDNSGRRRGIDVHCDVLLRIIQSGSRIGRKKTKTKVLRTTC
jgi:hypothetical protein